MSALSLTSGHRLGPYEIVAPLAAGGMGEVYKALDTRLDRTVAIKIVSGVMIASADARARMEREARAISRLNHPNICALYDIGTEAGTDYLVLEYLQGDTLARRIAAGPLPIAEALPIAMQVCDALDRAHRAGFVHRDLKPANVMLTRDGAKLLDFGLAKQAAPIQTRETIAGSSLSERGTIAGTLHYMAPEQVEGREADARTDIFAFGVVLHEMLTGTRAFDGGSPASVISAILRDAPPRLHTLMPAVPPALDRVVRRCLDKDPDERWQSARDLLFELRDLKDGDEQRTPTQSVAPGRRVLVASLAAATAIAIAASAAALWLWTRQPVDRARQPFHLDVVLPDGYASRMDTPDLALSHDGRFIAIALSDPEGTASIFLRSMDDSTLQRLPGTESGVQPFWSPDDRRIGFFANGWLQVAPVAGGVVQRIAQVSPEPRGGAWTDDDAILYSPQAGQGIMRVPASGRPATAATTTATGSHRYPVALPGGRFLYFSTSNEERGIFLGSNDGTTPRKILDADARGAYSDGRLLFVRAGALLSQRFDSVTGSTSGEPELVAEAIDFGGPPGAAGFAVSPAGLVVYSSGNRIPVRNVVWRDRRGAAGASRIPPQRYSGLALSLDDRQLALTSHERLQTAELWLMDVERGVNSRLSAQQRYDWFPVWAPDGRLFFRASDTTFAATLIERQPGGDERAVKAPLFPTSTRDGRTFIGHETAGGTGWDVWTLTDERIAPLISTSHNEVFGVVSPDGRWIAWMSDESGPFDVYVATYPGLREKQRIGSRGGAQPSWRADGRELYFLAEGSLMAVPVGNGDHLRLGTPAVLFPVGPMRENGPPYARLYAPTSDGQRFVLLEPAAGALRAVLSVLSRPAQ
jgi:serine/threonine protein kinase